MAPEFLDGSSARDMGSKNPGSGALTRGAGTSAPALFQISISSSRNLVSVGRRGGAEGAHPVLRPRNAVSSKKCLYGRPY